MQEHQLTISKTARYFTLGQPDSELAEVWFVCHGYGQLAADFLNEFEVLKDDKRLIVAPEGLSRFYWQGFDGRIGASWMTRENRVQEIADYVDYLDALYNKIFEKVKRESVKVTVLGFSQGTATVCRWVCRGKSRADKLIVWAGHIPPDLDLNENRSHFQKLQLSFVAGEQDEIAPAHAVLKQEAQLKKFDIPYQLRLFEGGHHLDADVLQELASV